jgi:outer membrane lipoprotein-sorting protein
LIWVRAVRRWRVLGIASLLALVAGCQGGSGLAFWTWGKATPYEGNVLELFSSIHERYQTLQSCQLEYEVRVTEAGATRVRSGTAWVRGTGVGSPTSPGSSAPAIRLEEEISFAPLQGASHEVRVSDGREAWVYRPGEQAATVQPLSLETQERLAEQVAKWGPLSQVLDVPEPGPNLRVEEVGSRRGKLLRIETSQGSAGGREPWFRRVVWVDARDLMLQQMEVQGAQVENGRLLEYARQQRYWGYQLNPELADDLFRFTAPARTHIERLPPR